jgi:alkylation response protein AidB-like acyl-CoA dehydrogenase
VSSDLAIFGDLVLSPRIISLVADAERQLPSISTHNTFGAPRTHLFTSRGWQELQDIGIQEGIVAIPFEAEYGHHSRMYQFVKYHLWSASSAYVTCPSAMADGAARLLSRHLADPKLPKDQQKIFGTAYRKLISRDPKRAWTSGQWMTERTGGSDVRGTETTANLAFIADGGSLDGATDTEGLPLGPYVVNGFKWFSSATDSHMAILLARTESGISSFFAPMRRCPSNVQRSASEHATPSSRHSELNGISIQRLKPKLGTRAVPTGELVLKGTRAWMIGEEGRGTREIATILNITRIHTALTNIALWGRGLAIARAFARVRKVDGGRPLHEVPAHVRTLAANTLNYAAHMHLGFFAVALLGISEQPHDFDVSSSKTDNSIVANLDQAAAMLRLITPVTKAECSKTSVAGLQECMEALGGVGYLEDEQEFNVARLFRDANVGSIWEGTTEVMATDVVRVMKGKDGEKTRRELNAWVEYSTKRWHSTWATAQELVRAELGKVEEMWTTLGVEELRFRGRSIMKSLAWIVSAILLIEDAGRSQDGAASELARRWVAQRALDGGVLTDWTDEAALDQQIVFGHDSRTDRARL